MKDRLIELCENLISSCKSSSCVDCEHNNIDYPNCMSVHFAEAILADGWMRPPVKAGDKVYKICTKYVQPFMNEYTVENYGIPVKTIMGHYAIIPFEEIGKTVFLDEKEAEKAL